MEEFRLGKTVCSKTDEDGELPDSDGVTALQLAAAHGQERVLDSILEQRGICVDTANNLGWTSLMHAARNGHSTIVEKLIAFGANVFLTNRYGANLLSLAVASDDKSTIIAVIHAVSKNVDYISSNSPLLIASLFGNCNAVKLLLGYNCDPNSASPLGLTPLMMASVVGNLALANLLIRFGADGHILNYSNQTALDIAVLKDHEHMITLLQGQCNAHSIGNMSTCCLSKTGMHTISDSPTNRRLTNKVIQDLIGKKNLEDINSREKLPMQKLSPITTLHSPRFYRERNPTFSLPSIHQSLQTSLYPSPTKGQILGPNVSTLPSSPSTKHTHGLFSFSSERPSFFLHSPSPSRPQCAGNASCLSPRWNLCNKKYSPNGNGFKFSVNINSEKKKIYNVNSSPVQSEHVTSSQSASRNISPDPKASPPLSPNVTPDNSKKNSNTKMSCTSFLKGLSKLKSPKRCFSPQHQISKSPVHLPQTRSLGKLLLMMDLQEFTHLFFTHELEVDTFLALNEKDLEDIGIENQVVRKDILNKILQLKHASTK